MRTSTSVSMPMFSIRPTAVRTAAPSTRRSCTAATPRARSRCPTASIIETVFIAALVLKPRRRPRRQPRLRPKVRLRPNSHRSGSETQERSWVYFLCFFVIFQYPPQIKEIANEQQHAHHHRSLQPRLRPRGWHLDRSPVRLDRLLHHPVRHQGEGGGVREGPDEGPLRQPFQGTRSVLLRGGAYPLLGGSEGCQGGGRAGPHLHRSEPHHREGGHHIQTLLLLRRVYFLCFFVIFQYPPQLKEITNEYPQYAHHHFHHHQGLQLRTPHSGRLVERRGHLGGIHLGRRLPQPCAACHLQVPHRGSQGRVRKQADFRVHHSRSEENHPHHGGSHHPLLRGE